MRGSRHRVKWKFEGQSFRGYIDSESRSGHANGRNYVTVEADKCLIRAHYTYSFWRNECHDNRNVQAPATLARPLP